ncbi:unnamed protein product [Oikopleura dioica]|uniref:Uncharacterized protein n=1 Tax=Oikopleura dioica TaxID=34765 RepID=E4YGL3_OIKDI|nr:unnamed protein product [Oikopleura dioica]
MSGSKTVLNGLSESELKKNEIGEQGGTGNDEEREKLRNELVKLGPARLLGVAGHYWGDDRGWILGGDRPFMEHEEMASVLRLLALGEKKVNLKFLALEDFEVAVADWTMQYRTATMWGRDDFFYLWIGNKEGGLEFKATAQQISVPTGQEANRQELRSTKDGKRQVIKYEVDYHALDNYGVRFNITIL